MSTIIEQAKQYCKISMKNLSTSDRVKFSRLGKKIVLAINSVYKKTNDPKLMELMKLMKLVTFKKRKIDKRLKGPIMI